MKLDITYLSSVSLSVGTADAILALFGTAEVLILLLMTTDSGSAKILDTNLSSLVSVLYIPGALLEFRYFRMVLISLGVILEPQLEEGIETQKQPPEVFCKKRCS